MVTPECWKRLSTKINVVFLASGKASYIIGVTVTMDGSVAPVVV
jgi:hypothetical protein